jgi:hypothetical protein
MLASECYYGYSPSNFAQNFISNLGPGTGSTCGGNYTNFVTYVETNDTANYSGQVLSRFLNGAVNGASNFICGSTCPGEQ